MPNSPSRRSLAVSSFFTLRPVMARFAPSLAKAVAMPNPMEPAEPSFNPAKPAPVMMMVFPVK